MPINIVVIDDTTAQGREDVERIMAFEQRMHELDLGVITREGWEEYQSILTWASINAGDTERGKEAYEYGLLHWRRSQFYDGYD